MRSSVVATGIAAPGEQPARDAPGQLEGFVFRPQMHRPQPFPTTARPSARASEPSPAAQLRTPSGEPAIPSFGPAPTGESRPARPGARLTGTEPRGPSFIERMKSFGFSRPTPARPVETPAAEEPQVHKPELVEASDIPAFLRRQPGER